MWCARTINKTKKRAPMEALPSDRGTIAALLLINFCVIFSEASVINIPESSIICLPGKTTFNLTLANGIGSGVFTSIENTTTRQECVRKSCDQHQHEVKQKPKQFEVAFTIGDLCYMVKCIKKEFCEVREPDSPSAVTISITPYTWFDAAPLFVNTSKVIQVRENNQRDQIVMNVHAFARSRWHQNASVRFSIVGGNEGGMFHLRPHPDGQSVSLLASKTLDRETIATFNLTIQATNLDENKTSFHVIKVVVLDENDNGPVFPSSMKQTIFSNVSAGTEIFRVRATDADTEENANIQYILETYRYLFRVLPRSGTIILKQKIRIDKPKTFNIVITARNDAHRSTGNVELFVQAVNEFKPFFENLKYDINVSEYVSPGTSILKVSAKDSDTGIFGALNYSIVGGNISLFRIDNEGVIRTSRSLLQHGGKLCSILISVRDHGDPPKKADDDTTVRITIETIEKITFDLPLYHVTLMENTPERSEILRVRAVPGRTSESLLNEKAAEKRLQRKSKDVVYTIVNEDVKNKFYVDPKTGQIIIMAPMDYEKNREFRLIVKAENVASRKLLTDTTTVVVQLLDVNDNAPRFESSVYDKVVQENTLIDSSILRVTATDRDSGRNAEIQFEITHGNVNESFRIDTYGVVKLRHKLTGLPVKLFNLTVVATDRGSPRLSSQPTTVYIRVNKDPYCGTAICRASVNESCPVTTEILRIRATNVRPENSGDLRYFFYDDHDLNREVNRHFKLDAMTGAIKLVLPLDYETTASYVYFVETVDSRTAATIDTVLVRIEVIDVNDNYPVFLRHKYKVVVQSIYSLGSTLLQLKASDKDSGDNAKLRFKIASGSEGFFGITSRGSIVLSRSVKLQNLRLFNLTVFVSDQGQPPLTADRQAQVSLLVFQPYKVPVIFLKATAYTISLRFNLKYLETKNVAKYGIIAQEFTPDDSRFAEYSEREPVTWYQVYGSKEDGQNMYRYITTIIQSNTDIETKATLDIIIGTENCKNKKEKGDYCNGPLTSGSKYRFQLRAFVENTGPFTKFTSKDSEFTESFFVELPSAQASGKQRGQRNYDVVVYSVGTGLVLVVVLAFLRGFYSLKLDRKRIHEEKKGRISFPVSNPRFSQPEYPLEKIRTLGPARKLVAVNQDKGSDFSRQDEDDGSSPDSALDESTRPLTGRRRPNLQEMRLKTYFNSVESAHSCNSCDHVKVFCFRETTA